MKQALDLRQEAARLRAAGKKARVVRRRSRAAQLETAKVVAPYLPEHAEWLKIRNLSYSQWVRREELFERERKEERTFQHWDKCALACDAVELEYA